MSPVQRPISGTALLLTLEAEMQAVREQLHASSRSARTLVKEGPLRVTLMGLQPGGTIAPHSAGGPISVHVLEGTVEFEAAGESWLLETGALLALDAGVVHSVSSREGGIFLLTIALTVPSDLPR